MNPEKHHQPPHHIFWENHKKDNSNAIFKKSAESPKNPSRKGFKGQESFCNMKPSEHFELAKKLESSAGTNVSLKKAVHHYETAADNGLVQAQFRLGVAFSKGELGLEKNVQKAFTYFQLAANQGFAPSQYSLANFFYKGLGGFKKSYEKAFKYYKLAADQGHEAVQYIVACCYSRGKGVEKSKEKAFEYFKSAADQGHINAHYKLLGYHESKYTKSLKEMFEYEKSKADEGVVEAQYVIAECFRRGGHWIKESWRDAFHYYKLAAAQGHIKAIRLLFECHHYGKRVEESQEEALNYLKQGTQLNDPECQYQLGLYYNKGQGNLTLSTANAYKYFKLAADQKHQSAIRALRVLGRILHPQAQEVNIQSYLHDQNISTLEAILKSYVNYPIFLEKFHYSWEEAQVICDAMIENPRFTFMCKGYELPRLFFAFELKGYNEKNDLEFEQIFNPNTNQETWGCVFIGNDLRDRTLKFVEEDPEVLERKHLESLAELQREENKNRAREIYASLPKGEITYPGSQELNIDAYLEDRKIDTLKKIFESSKDRPIYLRVLEANYAEIAAIREAMIENPRFTFFCSTPDNYSLEESFHLAGYGGCFKKKVIKGDARRLIGFVFKGKK